MRLNFGKDGVNAERNTSKKKQRRDKNWDMSELMTGRFSIIRVISIALSA